MEKNQYPQDDLLHEVLYKTLNDEIGCHRKESGRDLKAKQLISSESPFVRHGGLSGLLNCEQTNHKTNKQTNKKLQSGRGNIGDRKESQDLDLFIRPDGLPITFVVASSRAEQRRQVKIKRQVLM